MQEEIEHRTVTLVVSASRMSVNVLKSAIAKYLAYRRWATVENLKRMARTKLYMDEHGYSYEGMAQRKAELAVQEKALSEKISAAQSRLAEINVLKTHIVNYSKTKEVYVAYRKSGYSKKFLAEHEADIIIHKAAKKAFDELGVKKLPTVKSLQVEFAEQLSEKKAAYAELKKVNIPPQTGQQNGGNRSRVTVEMSPGVRLQVQAVE